VKPVSDGWWVTTRRFGIFLTQLNVLADIVNLSSVRRRIGSTGLKGAKRLTRTSVGGSIRAISRS